MQLAMIKSRISGVDRSKPVAVLGSTPEFRDFLFESGFHDIYLLERNHNFMAAMSRLRVYRNAETVIEGDWLKTLPTRRGRFALILSDFTSGNIPYDLRKEFYNKLAESLAVGGLFFDKVLTHPGKHIPLDLLVEKYAELPLNLLYVNHFSCEALFCSELLDPEQVVDSSRFYTALDQRIKNSRVRAFAQQAKKITPPGCMWWYGRQWGAIEADYCSTLERMAIEDDELGSPYFGRLKYFASIKKT